MDKTVQNLNVVLQILPRFPTHLLIFKGNRIHLKVQEIWQKTSHNGNFMVDILKVTAQVN